MSMPPIGKIDYAMIFDHFVTTNALNVILTQTYQVMVLTDISQMSDCVRDIFNFT